MKIGIIYTLVLCMVVVGCGQKDTQQPAEVAEPIDSIPMIVMRIQQCSRLYTAEYKVRKIVTQDDEQTVEGKLLGRSFSVTLPTGKRSIAIPVDATIKAYIDFAEFTSANVSRHGDKIEITLPDPQAVMTSTRIDHDHTTERVPLLRSRYTDAELSAIERKGRQSIVNSIPKLGIVESARANAATLLIPIIEQMGFDRNNITITFRQDYVPADLIRSITAKLSDHGTAQ